MFERLSGDYNRGYTKAIQDMMEVFEYIPRDLKHHKKTLNAPKIKMLLNCCLENREKMRENMKGFIRWNSIKNGFEWFDGRD